VIARATTAGRTGEMDPSRFTRARADGGGGILKKAKLPPDLREAIERALAV
jgi:hypothetical protein